VCLRYQTKRRTIAIETPGPTKLNNLNPRFVMSVKQLIRDFSGWCLVGEFQCGRSEPLDVDNRNEAVGENTSNRRIGLKSFELTHESGAISARF
jgi:hypothetical protein